MPSSGTAKRMTRVLPTLANCGRVEGEARQHDQQHDQRADLRPRQQRLGQLCMGPAPSRQGSGERAAAAMRGAARLARDAGSADALRDSLISVVTPGRA